MAREIKFRGRMKRTKQWMYGDLAHVQGQPCIQVDVSTDEKKTVGMNVDPDSVGQFTGLHDKNGKEIYEGDIVKYVYSIPRLGKPSEERTDIGYVGFLQQEAGFVIVFKKRDQRLGRRSACEFCVEVIGNIYDNPELLNKED